MNVYMARQPIFDLDNNVYAYELLYRSNAIKNEYTGVSGDESTANVFTNAFFGLDVKNVIGKAKGFINFTENLLLRGIPKLISPEILVVEVLENQLTSPALLDAVEDLHERGYMIALDDFEYSGAYNELFRIGDLVKIDFRTSPKSIEETAYVCRYSNKIMLAEKVETREEFEYAKKLGCTFMQGYYFAKPAIMSGVSAQPLPINILEVMRLLANPDSEISAIAKVLERDSAMTQRILRLINSVYFGMSNRISTIHQAVVTLGLDCLREWIYLMGMQRILGNDSIELSRLALLHAKFCKKVSLLLPEAEKNCESFYLMGLLSMIVFVDDKTLSQTLDELPVSDDIKNGVLRREGLYGDVFDLTLSYINGSWESVDEIAARYGLESEQLSEIFVECTKEVEDCHLV
ncbi:MAG: EAL and HDOD domain-containing protein [Oscillospiraceae bacterium]